jgi:hypothetical protein
MVAIKGNEIQTDAKRENECINETSTRCVLLISKIQLCCKIWQDKLELLL